MLTTI